MAATTVIYITTGTVLVGTGQLPPRPPRDGSPRSWRRQAAIVA